MQFAFLLDNFVYVLGPNTELLTHIKVEGVWQNPREVSTYTDANGFASYDPETHDYPLSISMLDLIKQSTMATNMQPLVQMPTDISNNAKSDIQPNQQK